MLGEIIGGLTDATTAASVIATVAEPAILARVTEAASAGGVTVGTLVAAKMRHLVEHGSEDIWLDLIATMSGSPQPGAAAIARMLGYAFPDPVRVRVKRSGR